MKVSDGSHLPETFDRAQYSLPQWLPDGSDFFLNRAREGAERGSPDYYLNSVNWFHWLGTDPRRDIRIAEPVTAQSAIRSEILSQ